MTAAPIQDLILARLVRQAVERLQKQEPNHHFRGVRRAPAAAAIGRRHAASTAAAIAAKFTHSSIAASLPTKTVELACALRLHEQVRRRRRAPEFRELRWGAFHARRRATATTSLREGFEKCPESFRALALADLEPLGILDRGRKLADALWAHLPGDFESATEILLRSLTPPLDDTQDLGLAVFFYLPHVGLVAKYGLEPTYNAGRDPFEAAMRAQYELTQRFSAEFSIRPFLIREPQRTLDRLVQWTTDPSAHVRRLCSEGSRPRLPWAMRLPAFVQDPRPALPILEALKDDPSLYVRRSVANHLGDIAKDHPELVFSICERWLKGASNERRWVIRHALRHPAKKGVAAALQLRAAAGAVR